MEFLQGLLMVARGVYLVGTALVGYAAVALKWAVLHPLGAVLVGAGLLVASYWLGAQPWAGAGVLAEVVGLGGKLLFGVGIGAWLGQQILLQAKVVLDRVLSFLGWVLRIPALEASPIGGLFSGPLVPLGPAL